MSSKIIIANFKNYISLSRAQELCEGISKYNDNILSKVIIAPSILHLISLSKLYPQMHFAAQDISSIADEYGAFTGEILAEEICVNNVHYAIIGHTERRNYNNETNDIILSKLLNAMVHNITPILCIGEILEHRNSGEYKNYIYQQLSILSSCPKHPIIIAYEPVWSIGTGVVPSISQIEEMALWIDQVLCDIKLNYKLIYGGSVSASNKDNILQISNIDGLLVGKASLNILEFANIIQ